MTFEISLTICLKFHILDGYNYDYNAPSETIVYGWKCAFF